MKNTEINFNSLKNEIEKLTIKGQFHLNNHKELKTKIDACFPNYFSNIEKVYCIKNNIHERPKCIECGKEISFNGKSYRYNKFCSSKCSNSNSDKKEKTKINCLKKYGVDNPMKDPSIVEKAKNNYKSDRKEILKRTLEKNNIETLMDYNNARNKIKETNIKKYGVDNPMKDPSIKNRMKIIQSQNNFDKVFNKKRIKHVIPQFKKEDYIGYSKKEEYSFKCKYCGTIFKDWFDCSFKFEPRCPKCFPKKVSIIESEIRNFIQSNYNGKIIFNDRDILNGKEIDIYLPDIKKAFEINGLYYHSINMVNNDKLYHVNKTSSCENKGIMLFHIYEDDWKNNNKKFKYRILNEINSLEILNDYSIKEITDKRIINPFIKNNYFELENIEKYDLAIALYNSISKLIAIMFFNEFSVNNYELYFVPSMNFSYYNSFDILINYFKNTFLFNEIIFKFNRNWNNKNFLLRNNFIFDRYVSDHFYYINKNGKQKRLVLKENDDDLKIYDSGFSIYRTISSEAINND